MPDDRSRAALHNPDFRKFIAARVCSVLALQMLSVAVGWQVYDLTRRPLDLGYVGLVQFLPAVCFALLTGYAADRFDRRHIVIFCNVVLGVCAIALMLVAGTRQVWPIYLLLVVIGSARAFRDPASQSFLTNIVPLSVFNTALAWSSSCSQVARIVGPALGGLLYGVMHVRVYLVAGGLFLVSGLLVWAIRVRPGRAEGAKFSLSHLFAGVRYVIRQQVLLGSISLDLFAVLFGGAVALMPVFARDILSAGPTAFGLLRSAPSVGAAAMALTLALRPLGRNVGRKMFACVALFGVATVVFGLSRNIAQSLGALVVLGAADMVSVNVRLTLEQIVTPPEMRGRVSAVNMIFIGASNELGEFESGVTAAWWGAVPAVVIGGLGTCAVVALWAVLFPDLRRFDRLDVASPKAAAQ
jgi:MFS family permease